MTKKQKSKSFAVRPPIITILGHVDHGKTTLLDKIRKTNIVATEQGGITQHIGAYQVEINKQKITFIDTPGHEAFAKMRSRGANVADIAILVVAGNDGIKPQTIESLNHIKAAKIPCIVAINKTDLPDINLDKIKKQLTKAELNLEEFGGDIPVIPLSAKTGKGIDKLLEMILLLSELNQIKDENPNQTMAVIIESSRTKHKGCIATVVVRSGLIKTGEKAFCQDQEFKIKALTDWKGKRLKEAKAGNAVEIMGWKYPPDVGNSLLIKNQIQITSSPDKQIIQKEDKTLAKPPETALEETALKIILKADTVGTLEAIIGGIKEKTEILSSGVGNITESDILLAKTTDALVLGFNIKPNNSVSKLASTEKVLIKTYDIIYKLFDEVDEVVEIFKTKGLDDEIGEAKVIAIFQIKKETVLGVKVVKGKISRGDKVKIINDEDEVDRAHIKSLKHHKEDINQAEQGMEAGVILSKKLEILTGYSIIAIG